MSRRPASTKGGTMRRVVLLLLALVAPMLAAVPADAHDAAACATSGRLGDQLAKEATYVEHNVPNKSGRNADYVYHFVSGSNDGQDWRVIPAHSGGAHALESAYSPSQPDGLLYFADMSILHWLSNPCSQGDLYAYAVNVGCAHEGNFAKTGCLFDAWVGLQTQDSFGGGAWDTTWGLSHRKNASSRASCYADGGQHQIADYAYNVRTWLYLDGSFTAPSPDWPFNSRKSTSKQMLTGETHTLSNGPCWPDWCDASVPPNNDSSSVFDSCVTV